jgi:membrane-bound metal-dependent hydrolase YbcI (DUF457 family)
MDPFSHAALGRTLMGALPVSGRPGRSPRGRVLAAVLGSLSPDIDAAILPFGWDRYLRVHEIGTHTIIGSLLCGLVTAAVIHRFVRPARYSTLALAAWAGAASHVLLDLLSGARLRPGWPVVDTVVSLPVVAMADPWLLTLCVAGPIALWFVGRSERQTTAVILGATGVFLLAKSLLGMRAVSDYREASGRTAETVLARAVEAKWATLQTWHIYDRTERHLRAWRAGTSGAYEMFSWPLEAEPAAVTNSRSLSTVRNFLRAHELGFAVALPQDNGHTLVLWSDIRFCWDAGQPGARTVEPVVQPAHGGTRLACALWFGGEIDSQGLPLSELVRIGNFTQTRRPE